MKSLASDNDHEKRMQRCLFRAFWQQHQVGKQEGGKKVLFPIWHPF